MMLSRVPKSSFDSDEKFNVKKETRKRERAKERKRERQREEREGERVERRGEERGGRGGKRNIIKDAATGSPALADSRSRRDDNARTHRHLGATIVKLGQVRDAARLRPGWPTASRRTDRSWL